MFSILRKPAVRRPLLLAAVACACHTPALAQYHHVAYSLSRVSAAVCDTTQANEPALVRTNGIYNNAGRAVMVTCPLPKAGWQIKHYEVSGRAAPGTEIVCSVIDRSKTDNGILKLSHLKISGLKTVQVQVGGHNNVAELQCSLPAKAALYALEAMSWPNNPSDTVPGW